MALSDKSCIPCKGGVSPLSAEEIMALLPQLDGWEIEENNRILCKKMTFKNYAKALQFVHEVSLIAESHQHHPDMTFGWGYCHIKLQTHSINGLHENDFIIAAKIDQIPVTE